MLKYIYIGERISGEDRQKDYSECIKCKKTMQ
jgi:hypothetical protein